MNIVEDFKSFLASFTGLTARLEKVTTDLTAAFGTIAAKDQEIVELKAKLEAAPSAEALKAAQDQVTTLTAEVGAEKARAEKAEKDLTDYKAEETIRFNKELANHTGAPGLKEPLNTVKTGEKNENKPDLSNLKGRERIAAAIKNQLSK